MVCLLVEEEREPKHLRKERNQSQPQIELIAFLLIKLEVTVLLTIILSKLPHNNIARTITSTTCHLQLLGHHRGHLTVIHHHQCYHRLCCHHPYHNNHCPRHHSYQHHQWQKKLVHSTCASYQATLQSVLVATTSMSNPLLLLMICVCSIVNGGLTHQQEERSNQNFLQLTTMLTYCVYGEIGLLSTSVS